MAKKLIFIFILVGAVAGSVSAQKKRPWRDPFYDAEPYHFGFAFSLGKTSFAISHSDTFNQLDTVYSIEYSGGALFGASMIANLKLADNWDLRTLPGLMFCQRSLNYLLRDDLVQGDDMLRKHPMKIETTLIQFPIIVKYRAVRESNYRPYIFAGLNPAVDLAARKKPKDDEKPKIRLKKFDVYAEVGVGLDNYLHWFKYSTELKFSYGLFNIVKYDDTEYTNAYRRLGSKMVTLVLCFE
ncbi:MAG: PorT family protein [Salinivirgaceae bacterium]|jgi:hypothetical protein|nr:PorT family protein [Salinivirgaceae bacterium]